MELWGDGGGSGSCCGWGRGWPWSGCCCATAGGTPGLTNAAMGRNQVVVLFILIVLFFLLRLLLDLEQALLLLLGLGPELFLYLLRNVLFFLFICSSILCARLASASSSCLFLHLSSVFFSSLRSSKASLACHFVKGSKPLVHFEVYLNSKTLQSLSNPSTQVLTPFFAQTSTVLSQNVGTFWWSVAFGFYS